MKSRLVVLLFLLFIQTVMGVLVLYMDTGKGKIKVTGKVIKVTQIQNNCIIDLGEIIAFTAMECKTRKGDMVTLVGTKVIRLIEAIRGKIVVEDALFDKTEKELAPVISFEQKSSWLQVFRNYCSSVYQRFLPKEESALLAGIVLGDKENIGYDFYQRMVSSGTIHIAVASGYNLMLVGGSVLTVLFWIYGRKRATVIAIILMFVYSLLAGFEAPVFRALMMATFLYIAEALGRKQSSSWLLFLSIWVMLVWDLSYLWSVSFQLSIMASIGLIVLAPAVQEYLSRSGWQMEGEWLSKMGLLTTVCTMLMTAPIIWFHFGRISIIGVFSNVFVIPLIPPIMIFGALMLIAPALFYVPTYALLHLVVLIIKFFGS